MSQVLDERELARYRGKSLDGLSVKDHWKLAGSWMATELYSPQRLPLRLMQVIGPDPASCIKQLRAQQLDPELYEYVPIPQPYEP